MKKYIYSLVFTATALISTACSDEVVNDIPQIPDSQKEMIEFSLSDGNNTPQTRAATQGAFTNPTRLVMYIRSNKDNGTTDVLGNKTIATTKACENSLTDHSDITFESAYKRYWDDAFGRKAYLSIYAVAIPGNNTTGDLDETKLSGGSSANTWATCADADAIEMTWSITKGTQTETTLAKEDLVYSNNIQKTGKDGRTWYNWNNLTWNPSAHTGAENQHGNGCLQFELKPATPEDPTGPGYFDKGHLKFYHALTRITIELEEGDGFDGNKSTTADFKFTTTDANIKLLGMYTSGKLDMKTGKWTKDAATPINVMIGSTTAANGTYLAQMLPDYEFVKDATTNVLQFEIDNNQYFITQKELFKALNDVAANNAAEYGYDATNNKFVMQQGKNYKFKIKVNKKQIEAITATILAWDDVTAADHAIDNSHVTFSLYNPTGTACTDIKFLRHAESLGKIYTDDTYTANAFSGNYKTEGAATLSSASPYSTNWYYENNQTAYHFRTLNSTAYGSDTDSEKGTNLKNDGSGNSYFEMASAATADYHWGAPLKVGATLKYDTLNANGFKDNIYKGITSTTSNIVVTEFHMMSNVIVNLKTKTDGYVNLKNATVTFTQIAKNANVDVGTGYVTPVYNSSDATQQITSPSFESFVDGTTIETGQYTWNFVPQTMVRNGSSDITGSTAADADYVGITIHTTDNNEYYIVKHLSDITAKEVDDERNQLKEGKITRWYPGHKYIYNITITKKGIEAITCTVANWVTVTANDTKIDLES